ncbi:malto-oligosyltrehalose trehalohydrolase [Xanthocytophaga flava]|uniref:malto-oligosyltrehalose trehalohydrolase n=1 Tax=Xanthocytophaga flava TaxID=3048013 RepID=UPI0028D2824F|nr:malto-oligosyltrehalose trehalohydrolase [Xanthocytophaga flavus]MDJ1469844.1 malto-oligosyltrehalose trehalohydrolase [Xanthocytophaga flavus]
MRKPIGAFWNNGKSSFTVWAPLVSKVELEITSSNQEIGKRILPMKSEDFGYWTLEVEDVTIGDRYGYKLDDSQAYPDPASRSQPGGVQELSEVIASQSFEWNDQQWKGRPLSEMIIYELHVGTFTTEGTFDAIIEKLDYLLELGVNTIELMPVAQFSGNRNWGYDGVFPFAAQNSYGGPEGLKRLVDACHQKGIAVFLDVVYNHIGPEGSCMHHYGPYFSTKYTPVWGHPFNFDEPYSDEVRNYFIENALMWFDECHIDALRLDATDHILDFGSKHFLMELSEEVKALKERNRKQYVLVAERDLNDVTVLRSFDQCGYEFDGQWLDNFHHALRTLATNDRGHYYADFGEITHLQKAFEQTYVYNGTYSNYRKRTHGVSAQAYDYSRFVVFSQNHDQVGNRLLSDRLSTQVSFDMLKVVAGTYLLSPYVPLLFMGEEYAETNPFYYFISHYDLELIQAVREGRKKEFMGFQKEGMEYLDPQSEDTFLQSKLSWKYQEGEHLEMWNYYRKLIQIRKSHPVFRNFNRENVKSWIDKDAVLLWSQDPITPEDCVLLCIANFGKSINEIALPEGTWELVLDSQLFGREDTDGISLTDPVTVSLPAESFLVYQCDLSNRKKIAM